MREGKPLTRTGATHGGVRATFSPLVGNRRVMTRDDPAPGGEAGDDGVPRAVTALVGMVATPPERAVFTRVRADGPLPEPAVAARVDAPPAVVATTLADLEGRGVVAATPSGYALTEAGQALGPVVDAVDELRRRLDRA